jgi:hypothetical protein
MGKQARTLILATIITITAVFGGFQPGAPALAASCSGTPVAGSGVAIANVACTSTTSVRVCLHQDGYLVGCTYRSVIGFKTVSIAPGCWATSASHRFQSTLAFNGVHYASSGYKYAAMSCR